LRADDLPILYRSLHPYHGKAYFKSNATFPPEFSAKGATLSTMGAMMCLRRSGGLEGGGNWTHENADASNTRVSADTLVKAPLGILWFGGSSNEGMLPRHGHGPQPQVVDGRAIIEGIDKLRAMDIYTGSVLWEKAIAGVGSYFNNTAHQAGANGTGSNFVSLSDGIYVAMDRVCLRLDPANGEEIERFELPTDLLEGADCVWGYLNVEGDYLIGGWAPRSHAPVAAAKTQDKVDPDEEPESTAKRLPPSNPRTVGSVGLFVMDRRSGKILWSVNAKKLFRHNAICAGGGRLYAIDTNPVPALWERDKPVPTPFGELRVFDLASGEKLWKTSNNVSGTWLSYSREYDVLVEAGRKARDTLRDEPKGMRAYKGGSGEVLWHDRDALGPAMIRGNMVLKESSAVDLITGRPLVQSDPITGVLHEWTWSRQYGCNTPIASQNLLTFRSGAAGYYDLARLGGTGNFGGFRSSCTNNLIVAGGLLVAPDYTRTCTCSYQMQTSLALYSDSEAEMWTFTGANADAEQHVERIGVNLGAPGDRMDEKGTLWLEYPSVGGKSPGVKVAAAGEKMEFFRRHASVVSGEMPWVTASGARNIKSLKVTLGPDGVEWRPYTVRLYFAQPGPAKAGENVFDVMINGVRMEKGLDVVASAGGADRSMMKEYPGIEAGSEMVIELKAKKGGTVLCGVEILPER
jgi:outer membrane protein assembly factor BamB